MEAQPIQTKAFTFKIPPCLQTTYLYMQTNKKIIEMCTNAG